MGRGGRMRRSRRRMIARCGRWRIFVSDWSRRALKPRWNARNVRRRPRPQAGWRGRSEADRHAVGEAAGGVWPVVVAIAGRRTGGVGSGRFDQSRDGPQDAKKNGMTKRKIEYWVIPPDQDAEFVADMEDVLETYAEAYDPQHPVLCMDEQPVQLLKETRVPIAATKKHGKRVDYEYERNGTASIFMFAEPLSGFRQATARDASDQGRLGDRSGPIVGHALRRLREGDAGVRQPQHAHQRGVLRRRSRPSRRGRISSGSTSATRRSTAVG